MSQSTQQNYREVFKTTSLFGGVQAVNIIISIIRSKLIAVLLGPMGMGFMGLLTSTISFVSQLTNFGLGVSAVKDISTSYSSGNMNRISIVISVFNKTMWITGILGTLLTIIFSSKLSTVTFGNEDYTNAFIWISITLLFFQISSGKLAILQGMRRLKDLAKANVIGSILGLIISIPLYLIWGIEGIIPAIIISSSITLLVSIYYSKKIILLKVKVSPLRSLRESKAMISMGFMISLSGLITVGTGHIVRLYISHTSNIDQVGLYNAGFAIINTYVGLIFSAMATDYYPRLSAISSDNLKCNNTINQQAEIAILIIAPLIATFIIFINWGIILLYSTLFITINDMIMWAALGMLFKAISWSIGFIFLAKGASRLFFYNELIANGYILVLNIIGYKVLGLTGLGISFLVGYILVFIQYFIIVKIKYKFSLHKNLIIIFFIQLLIASICILTTKLIAEPYSYFIGLILIFLSIRYSVIHINKLIDLKELIRNFSNRKSN